MPKLYFIGVDVGTSSVRAGLVTTDGRVLKQVVKSIQTWNPEPDYFEQSSEDIWHAVCYCVKNVVRGTNYDDIASLSFDATCSLVVLGQNGEPLSVSKTQNPQQNVILWMDHRAQAETNEINDTKHRLLHFTGGSISIEMQMPKLLWLKRNAYLSTWSKIWRVFDLADYLTWRATGSEIRSLCTVVCKWHYDAMNLCWSSDFLESIGLEDLADNLDIIGQDIKLPGVPLANGVLFESATELGVKPGIAVSTALIDAHAGALSLFGCHPELVDCSPKMRDLQYKLALISGTSTCHMSLTAMPCVATGVWGPYKNAIIPGFFLTEAGQSATGVLLDYVIQSHSQYTVINEKLKENENIYAYLNDILDKAAFKRAMDDPCYLTKDVHVWPDFRGNRSPIGDPNLKGMISGADMNGDEESLAILYLAYVQALAYGTRAIIEHLIKNDRPEFCSMLFAGGLAKNLVYLQSHADICKLPVVTPFGEDMVIVGTAMLGACAARVYPNLQEASKCMSGSGRLMESNTLTHEYHDRKYAVFQEMVKDQRKYEKLMSG